MLSDTWAAEWDYNLFAARPHKAPSRKGVLWRKENPVLV
jgi:hypothetical protein